MNLEGVAGLEGQANTVPPGAESVAGRLDLAIELPARAATRVAPGHWRRPRVGPVDLRRSLQRGRNALADAIDMTLTAFHLLGALVLAASLVATVAGMIFPPSHWSGHNRAAWASRPSRASCQIRQRSTARRQAAECAQANAVGRSDGPLPRPVGSPSKRPLALLTAASAHERAKVVNQFTTTGKKPR